MSVNDLTLSISYPAVNLLVPGIPAVDSSGNVWFPGQTPVTNPANPTAPPSFPVVEISPLGAPTTAAFFTAQPYQAAISPLDNTPWLAFRGAGTVGHIAANGTAMAFPYNATGTDDGHQIAIDQNGNVYVLDFTNRSPYVLSNTGAVTGHLAGYNPEGALSILDTTHFMEADTINLNLNVRFDASLTGDSHLCIASCKYAGPDPPTSLAANSADIIWAIADNTLHGVDPKQSPNGVNVGGAIAGSPFTGGGLNAGTAAQQPVVWLAIDGGNSVWIPNYAGNSISEFSSTGTAITSTTGFVPSTGTCPTEGLAVDGSGDVWVSCASNTAPVVEFIGAATPLYTPLTPGHFGTMP
jgi:hypothetical protein